MTEPPILLFKIQKETIKLHDFRLGAMELFFLLFYLHGTVTIADTKW